MAKNTSITTFIPCDFAKACGEHSTHIRVSIFHNKKTWNIPAHYVISTTPVICKGGMVSFSCDIGLGGRADYDTWNVIIDAPRFNAKVQQNLADKFLPAIRQMIEDNTAPEDFENKIKQLVA